MLINNYTAGGAGYLDWQKSVKDKDLTTPPLTPAKGDRYIVAFPATGAWTGHDDDIAECTNASPVTWAFTTAEEGMATYVEDEDLVYIYDGVNWVKLAAITDHNDLSGLQGGTTSQYYHLTQADYNNVTGGNFSATTLTATGGTITSGSATQLGSIVLSDGSSNTWTITSPALSNNYILTLPVDDGTPGQYLQTDGSGNTSWASVSTVPVSTQQYSILVANSSSGWVEDTGFKVQSGTVTLGTWQGTAITDSYISSASYWNGKENPLTFNYPLNRATNTISLLYDTNDFGINGSNQLYILDAGISHNSLSGLQGGTTAQYYHLTQTEHGYVSGINAQSVLTTASPSFVSLTLTANTATISHTGVTGFTISSLADITIDAYSNTGARTVYILNSDATYTASLSVEGTINSSSTGAHTLGVITFTNGAITGATSITSTSFTGQLSATSTLANGVTATTQAPGDNTTKVATTAFVMAAIGVENLWDRNIAGYIYPYTSGDSIVKNTTGDLGISTILWDNLWLSGNLSDGTNSLTIANAKDAYDKRVDTWNAPLQFVSNVASITQAGATTDGYLSSTDWNSFNNKVTESTTVSDTNSINLTLSTYDISADLIYQDSATIDLSVPDANGLKADVKIDSINDTHIDWGTGTNQVSAVDLLIADANNYYTGTEVETALKEIGKKSADTIEPSGFTTAGISATTLSFIDGTRRFTITGTNFEVYHNGILYLKNTEYVDLPDTTGFYYIYYDATNALVATTTYPSFSYPLVATVYWNTTIDKGLLSDERHGITMDWRTHQYLHLTEGARYESGLTGTFGNTTFNIASGNYWDEDIRYSIGAQTTCNILYYNGASDWEWDLASTAYYKAIAGVLQYDNGTTLTSVTNSYYTAVWVFAGNDYTTPIYIVIGQREDATLDAARNNNTYGSLNLGTLPSKEMKLLYRVILQNVAGTATYVETQDLRRVPNFSTGTFIALSHSTLSDLGWGISGHTGTVSSFAGFNASGIATTYTESNYLLAAGTRDLTGDWTIATNNITLTAGTLTANKLVSTELEFNGNITIDAINVAANSTVYITNSNGTYVANLNVEGTITSTSTSQHTLGVITFTNGAIAGITSITDGTASWSSNSLSGFTSVSATSLTDGVATITGGAGSGFSNITSTKLTSPELEYTGDITIDAINTGANSTIYLLNSDGTYVANLNVEGSITGTALINAIHNHTNAAGGGQLTLAGSNSDVNITGAVTGQHLVYNQTAGDWENKTLVRDVFLQGTSTVGFYQNYAGNPVGAKSQGYFTFYAPRDFGTIVAAYLVSIPQATFTNQDVDLYTQYGTIGEAYNQHSASDTTSTRSGTINVFNQYDITTLLANLTAGDYVGVYIDHNAIGATVLYLGIRLVYNSNGMI